MNVTLHLWFLPVLIVVLWLFAFIAAPTFIRDGVGVMLVWICATFIGLVALVLSLLLMVILG